MTYTDLPLYPGLEGPNTGVEQGLGQPNRFVHEVRRPELTVLHPDQPLGSSALLLPGGGYHRVCLDKEGLDVARVLASWGITAAVLTYRQPGGVFQEPPLPLQDARRALSLLAEHSKVWSLDPSLTVLFGFSAGGHLALTTLREPGDAPVPPWLVLGYPVAGMRPPLVHAVSRGNLLGPDPSEALLDRFSAERPWTTNTPRGAFLLHADDDGAVPVANSLAVADALRSAGADVELLRHPSGGHGFGWGPPHGYQAAPDWQPALHRWLQARGLAR